MYQQSTDNRLKVITAPFVQKIPISDRFVTQLHICAVVQTLHIYKKIYPNSVPSKAANISTVIELDH